MDNRVQIKTISTKGVNKFRTYNPDGSIKNKAQYVHEKVDFRVTDRNKILAKANFTDLYDFMEFFDDVTEGSIKGRTSDDPKGSCNPINKTDERSMKWRFGNVEGFNTVDDVKKAGLEGRCSKKVANYVKRFRKELQSDGLYEIPNTDISCKKRRVWTDDGAELDIDAVMSGDPNYWVSTKRDGKYRVIRIVINYSASHTNKDDVFAKTIASAYVTAELIEQLGYGVEIYAGSICQPARGSINEKAVLFPIKRTQEPLDLQRLGYIGNVGFFRYFTFGVENELFGSSRGYASMSSKEMQMFLGADVYVSTSWGQGTGQKLQVRKVIEKLAGKEVK